MRILEAHIESTKMKECLGLFFIEIVLRKGVPKNPLISFSCNLDDVSARYFDTWREKLKKGLLSRIFMTQDKPYAFDIWEEREWRRVWTKGRSNVVPTTLKKETPKDRGLKRNRTIVIASTIIGLIALLFIILSFLYNIVSG